MSGMMIGGAYIGFSEVNVRKWEMAMRNFLANLKALLVLYSYIL
jgi:hypothetical protein